jgi:hypothetical protein
MMPNITDDPLEPQPSHPFEDMADKIAHMRQHADRFFGGAFVVVPPVGAPISTLIVDQSQDLVQFWSLLRAKADIELARLQAEENNRWKIPR